MAGTWVKMEQKGDGPGARSSHAITLVGHTAYSFGCEFTPRVPVDSAMYAFDLTTQTWSALVGATGDVPPPRVGVTMAAVGGTVYTFGGRDLEHKELNELYAFDTATRTWTLLSSGADGDGPPHRSYHSVAADAECGRVYVFGGCGDAGRLNDLWAYDVAEGRWEELPSPGEACRPRGGPGLAVAGGKVWVVYGFSGEEFDDVHCYDPATRSWAVVETTGDRPSPRSVFCAAGIGRHVVLFGGEVDPSDLGHLGAGKFSAEAFALDTETRAARGRGWWTTTRRRRKRGRRPSSTTRGLAGGARSRRGRRTAGKGCWCMAATRRPTTGSTTSTSSRPFLRLRPQASARVWRTGRRAVVHV